MRGSWKPPFCEVRFLGTALFLVSGNRPFLILVSGNRPFLILVSGNRLFLILVSGNGPVLTAGYGNRPFLILVSGNRPVLRAGYRNHGCEGKVVETVFLQFELTTGYAARFQFGGGGGGRALGRGPSKPRRRTSGQFFSRIHDLN